MPRDVVVRHETLFDAEVAGEAEPPPAQKLPHGQVIGRYILLEPIGEGGMGVVYAAYDPELDRRIALKLLRQHATEDGSLGRARLLREAQSMAKVSHPNVVGVHDAGTFEDRVFVAMELVVGRDLRAWLLAEPRTRAQILGAFLQAGRGLATAHAAGLVHRDFKPGNVLVGDDGVVRVADFGLARRFDADLAEPTAPTGTSDVSTPSESVAARVDSVTRTGAVLGTPAYMSAEQHLGRELDARSDQFSFCVALWEALQGERPFRAMHPVELMVEVTRGEIAPSTRDGTMPTWLRRVLMRGLAADPNGRWPTMQDLLAALGRDPTRRRRRWLLAGGGVLAIATASLLLARRPGPCEGGEESLAQVWGPTRARAVTTSFASTSLPFATDAAADVVRRLDDYGARWLDTHKAVCLAEEAATNRPQLSLGMRCVERRRRDLGALVDVLQQADAMLVERAHEVLGSLRALETCSDAAQGYGETLPPEDPAMREAADALRDHIATVKTLDIAGRWKDALALSEPTLAAAHELGDAPLIAEAELVHVGALVGNGRGTEAIAHLHDAAVWAVQGGHDVLLLDTWIALVWHTGVELGEYERGLEWARYADAMLARMGRPTRESGNLRASQSVSAAIAGHYDEALAFANEALAVRRRQQPGQPIIANTLLQVGNALISLGRYDEAKVALAEAIEVAIAALGPEHPIVGAIENSIGVSAHMGGEPAIAEAHWRRAFEIMQGALGPDHPDLFYSMGNIAEALLEQGKFEESLAMMRRVEAVQNKALPPEHREVGTTRHNIAQLTLMLGDTNGALAGYESALVLRSNAFGPDDPAVANTLTGLGETLLALGRPADARVHLERAFVIREAKPRRELDTAHTRIMLGLARAAAGGDVVAARTQVEAGVAALADLKGAVRDRLFVLAERWLAEHPAAG